MLLKNNKLMPYPILSPQRDDYHNIIFSLDSVDFVMQNKTLELKFNVSINDANIIHLIEENKLRLLLHTECPQTKYREIHTILIGENSLLLQGSEINGKLEISSLLISNGINGYSHPKFNNLFRDFSFNFTDGSIFGFSEVYTVIITKENEDLNNVQSIMSIIKYENTQGEKITVDYDTREKIIIKAHPSVYQYYYSYKTNKTFEPLIFSSLIIPALIEVLAAVKDTIEDQTYATKKWYRVLDKSLIKKMKIGLEKSLFERYQLIEIAQSILEFPIGDAFKNVSNIIER